MNDNITFNKDWYFPYSIIAGKPNGKITVILEDEGRRLVQVDFNERSPMYYIQKAYVNQYTGEGHWIDVHYDRSKNKMIRRFKDL